jgi:hypothetical protein
MPEDPPALSVAEIGSFFVGGHIHRLEGLAKRERISTPGSPVHFIDPNGELMAGQMYVQYVRLAKPSAAAPLLMWHGGGMTGVNWETTPDGRPGWQMFFLRAGFDTYISDAVERGRASWAPYPQVYTGSPYFRTAKEAWEETFRFGPEGSWHPTPRCGAPIPASVSRSSILTPSYASACPVGPATICSPSKPTTP